MQFKDILIAVLVMIIWGTNFAIMKLGITNLSPTLFVFLRTLAVGSLVFFVPRPKGSWVTIIGMGVLTSVLQNSVVLSSFNYGMTPGLSSVIFQTNVLFTMMLGVLFFKEKPDLRKWLGLVIAFMGLIIISFYKEGHITFLGISLVIAASFFCAVGNLILHKATISNMLSFIIWSNLISTVPLFGLSVTLQGFDNVIDQLKNLSYSTYVTVLYSSMLAGVCSYYLWGKLLQKYEAYRVASFSLSSPLFGLFAAYILLGEIPPTMTIVGGLLVIGGLVINQIDKHLLSSFKKTR